MKEKCYDTGGTFCPNPVDKTACKSCKNQPVTDPSRLSITSYRKYDHKQQKASCNYPNSSPRICLKGLYRIFIHLYMSSDESFTHFGK